MKILHNSSLIQQKFAHKLNEEVIRLRHVCASLYLKKSKSFPFIITCWVLIWKTLSFPLIILRSSRSSVIWSFKQSWFAILKFLSYQNWEEKSFFKIWLLQTFTKHNYETNFPVVLNKAFLFKIMAAIVLIQIPRAIWVNLNKRLYRHGLH